MVGNMHIDLQYIVQLKDLDVSYQYISDGYNIPQITDPFAGKYNISVATQD